MKNILALFLAATIFISGCKTIQLADFETGAPLQNKLPALAITNTVPQNTVPAMYGYYAFGYPQNDAHSMFTKMIEQNITNPIGEKYGYASYSLTVGDNKLGGWGYYMVSLLTLTAPNLFGMPFFVAKSSVEVTVKIENSSHELIGIYKATGQCKTHVAYYHGYGMMDALRAANIKSLQIAFSGIATQIEKDSSDLAKKLKEKGAVKN